MNLTVRQSPLSIYPRDARFAVNAHISVLTLQSTLRELTKDKVLKQMALCS
jgi:hypothetical protein